MLSATLVRTQEMLSEFWSWIGALPPSGASFLGTLAGSGLGLVALLVGALFNAHLNRRRDDRLRIEEAWLLTSALKAELSGINESLLRNADNLDNPKNAFVVPDIAHSVRVFPALLSKLGLLDVGSAREVIGAYVSIDQYCEGLLLMGGQISQNSRPDRRPIAMPIGSASAVAKLNRDLVELIGRAISKIDK